MIEVYQAEWCPYSSLVRQRLTELGVSFVAHQVPADKPDRDELRRTTGTDEIPAVVLEDGTVLAGDASEIVRQLDRRFSAAPGAGEHRERGEGHDVPGLRV